MAYKPIIFICISFKFIKIKCIHYPSCVIVFNEVHEIYNYLVNYDDIIM